MKLLFILLVLLAQLASCQDNGSFHKDVPCYESGKPSVYYSSIRKYELLLNLDTIENGFDSLQIRIWYNYPRFRTPKNIFILKKKQNNWLTQLYDYDKDTIKSIIPKSNLDMVIKNLISNKIMILPNMHDIKGLKDNCVDGESYTVEISTQQQYRLYNYHVPEDFQKNFSEAENFVNILELLKQEFNIPLAHWEK